MLTDWTLIGAGTYGVATRVSVPLPETLPSGRKIIKRREVAIKWIPLTQTSVQRRRGNENRVYDAAGGDGTEDDAMEVDSDVGATLYREALEEVLACVLLGKTTRAEHSGTYRHAPGFPYVYAAFVVGLTANDEYTIPRELLNLLPDEDTSKRNYMVMVQEYASEGSVRSMVAHGEHLELGTAYVYLFELAWSLFIAHTQRGIIYLGDICGNNVMLAKRPASMMIDDAVTFRILDLNTHLPLAHWSHTLRTRPVFIDLGFTQYHVPSRRNSQTPPPGAISQMLGSHYPAELYFTRGTDRAQASDIWQLGLVAISLAGRLPAVIQSLFAHVRQSRDAVAVRVSALASRNVIDLFMYPFAFTHALCTVSDGDDESLNTLLGSLGHPPRAADYRRQENLVDTFVELLETYARTHADMRRELHRETNAALKYGRFLSVAVLQAVLGRGWKPAVPLETWPESAFYRALSDPVIHAFMESTVTNPKLPFFQLMREIVASLHADLREIIFHMLAWNPNSRPTAYDVFMHPLFQQAFGVRDTPIPAEKLVYSAHQRSAMNRSYFDMAEQNALNAGNEVERAKREVTAAWLDREQRTITRAIEALGLDGTFQDLTTRIMLTVASTSTI